MRPLGHARNLPSGTLPDESVSERDDARKHKYQLLAAAKSLLPGEGVSACLEVVMTDKVAEVRYSDASGHASIHGVGVCGSVWNCPVCSARINKERGDEIAKAIRAVNKAGGEALLLTLTIQHNKGDRLDDLLDRLKSAWTDTQSGRPWTRFKKNHGYLGSITSFNDVLYGDHGWHPHIHAVVFVKNTPSDGEIAEIEDFISDRWGLMVDKHGGYASPIYGVNVRRGEKAAQYVTKFTREKNWDVAKELTSKRKSGHGLSAWQLLDDFIAGNEQAGYLFVEYSKATKGRSSVRWGRGLRDKLNLFCVMRISERAVEDVLDKPDEELLLESLEREEKQSRQVVTFTNKQWYHIASNNFIGLLLRVTELTRGDSERVWAWCVDIAGIPKGSAEWESDDGPGIDSVGLDTSRVRPWVEKLGKQSAG